MPTIVPAPVEDFIARLTGALPGLRAWAEPPSGDGRWWVETRAPANAVSWSLDAGFGFFDVDGEEPRLHLASAAEAAAHAVSVMGRRAVPA